MTSRTNLVATFEPERTIQPIYTGGDVSLSQDGRILATCLGEEALLTDLSTGRLLARIDGDGEIITALSITADATYLFLCSRSLSMQIHSLDFSGDSSSSIRSSLVRTLKPHATPVVTIVVDNSGTLVATGSSDGVIKVWDIRGGYITHTFHGHNGVISALHFFNVEGLSSNAHKSNTNRKKRKSADNRDETMMNAEITGDHPAVSFRLASGSEDGKIRIWDLEKRKAIATLDSHVSVVRGLNFSSTQNTLSSSSRDKTVILWDARSWKAKKVIPVLEGVEAVGFVESGTLLYTGGEHGRLRIWESGSGREVTQEQEAATEAEAIVHVIYNANQNYILTVHADQSLIFHSTIPLSFDSTQGQSIDSLPVHRRISGSHDEIIDLAYVTPDRSLLALATNSENIRLVSLSTTTTDTGSSAMASYFGADVTVLKGHEDIIICLDVDWSGCWLATGAKDNTARLWKLDKVGNSFQHVATFTGHAESIGAISLPSEPPPVDSAAHKNPLSHPPPFLLTGSQDKTIKKWDISKVHVTKVNPGASRAMYTRKAHEKDINAISVNHNSLLYASASQDRTVKVWSTEEGEVQGVLHGHRRGVWSVRFAAKETPPIAGNSGPVSSSHGLLLTGSGDKTIKIWSLADYSCLRTLEGHTSSVLKVLWMPLSSSNDTVRSLKRPVHIASAGGDGLVKIWDANTGETAATLDNHIDRIWALTVNPVDSGLISGGADSTVTFWKDTTSMTTAAAAAASTARIEEEQKLQNYIHRGSFREAIILALQLNHPARLFALFQSVADRQPPEEGSLSGLLAVDEVLAHLSDEQLLLLLSRVRDWNTNARTAVVAQRILGVVVRSYPAERLAAIRGRGWKDMLTTLAAYTERHYRRTEELIDETYLVEFTLREMEDVGFVGNEEMMVM